MSSVNLKIEETKFFLDELKNADFLEPKFRFFLSAFLHSCRSIFDYVLYFYAEAWNIFTINESICSEEFEYRAQQNDTALDFIDWYKQKKTFLWNCPQTHFLMTQRNISTHRQYPSLSVVVTQTSGSTLTFSSTIPLDVAGLVNPYSGSLAPSTLAGSGKPNRICFDNFPELPDNDAIQLCENFLQMMRGIVLEARRNWP